VSGVDAEISDTDLSTAIGARDQAALAALYDRYHVPAYQLAYLLLGEREAAEEAVLAAFLHLWRRPESYDPGIGGVRAWLLTGIRHTATARKRASRSLRRHESCAPDLEIERRQKEA